MRSRRVTRPMHRCLMTLLTRARRELEGFPERHEWAEAQVGEPSTRRMTRGQVDHCIRQLRYVLGEEPHAPRAYWLATPSQVRKIQALARRVTWRVSLEAWIRGRQLTPFRAERWDGHLRTLARSEATAVITGLDALADMEATLCPR